MAGQVLSRCFEQLVTQATEAQSPTLSLESPER
jgi:hypothetical protein